MMDWLQKLVEMMLPNLPNLLFAVVLAWVLYNIVLIQQQRIDDLTAAVMACSGLR